MKVDQVCIGSCTNSSLYGYAQGGRHSARARPFTQMSACPSSPGSRQVLQHAGTTTAPWRTCIASGRPDSGMRLRPLHRHGLSRQTPAAFPCEPSTATSRAVPEHADAQVYLVIPGNRRGLRPDRGTSPTRRTIGRSRLHVTMPEHFLVNDNAVLPPLPADEGDGRRSASRPQHQANSPRASPLPTA